MTAALPELPIAEDQRRLAAARALRRDADHDLSLSVVGRVDEARPDAIAVREPGGTTTYAELARRARGVAGLLVERGIGEGSLVAVGGERGADAIAAFLAVELVGAAYLPVDRTWPELRVRDVLRRSGAAMLLVCGDGSSDGFDAVAGAGWPVVRVAEAATRPPWDGKPRPRPDQVRYVLYTSGSTGAPKGAIVEHQGMANHLLSKVDDLGLTAADRVAQTAPLVFDISLWQMLAPLLVGARVHVLPDEVAHDATLLARALTDQGITVLEVVPTVLRTLLDEAERDAPTTALRWVLATGEELPPGTARRFARVWPELRLLNAYGPTECSDDVTHHVVGTPDADVAHLPIGGPIANTALYVLRRDGDRWVSCDTGEVGELFVGGAGVGRGYLGDPERTAEAFFRDPFARTATGRLYRTGDAVVVLPRGVLEYRGRIDRQVKIGGFRMEPGEVEAVLRGHPAVAACAVAVVAADEGGTLVARETKVDRARGRRLVAYVCPSGAGIDERALRDHLLARLPTPMVPQRFVVLPELPLTRNGKVDYGLLSTAPPAQSGPYAPPRGPREEAVAAAIAELLAVDRVGRDESFLALGGDSLLAIRLVARLRAAGYALTMRDVVLAGTTEGIAARLTPLGESIADHGADDHGGVRRRPLTPQQSGVHFHWKLAPDNPYYSYQGVLRLTGPLDEDRLTAAWDALLRENPALLARFGEDDDGAYHEYPHWKVPLPPATDLTALPEAEREEHFRAEAFAVAAQPFDLHGAPALRVRRHRLGPTEHRLLVTMHEVLLDGWGATVLFRRLAELYEDPRRPGDPGRYDRYLDWQRGAEADLDEQARYWRDQLSGELPVLQLPGTRPRNPSYRGGIVEAVVDAGTTSGLRALSGELGCTPFMLFLGAYALVLGYYTGADEVVVGAPIANREHAEQAEVAAFLINMLPLRLRLDPARTVRDHLVAVRDTVVAGYAAAAYPFGWMLRDLPTATRGTSTTPVFQTMLNHLTYPSPVVRARDVTFAFTELDTGFTKYDLSLYVQAHSREEFLVQLAHHVDVVDEDTARRVLESTLSALDALVRDPDAPVADVDLLPAADRALVEEFSRGD
ncbi:Plipastatin synthase subunit C [Actinosynnema sp. ALI-1.44]